MSYTSDFLNLQNKNKKKKKTGDSFTDEFNELESSRLEKEIAPIATSQPIAPVREEEEKGTGLFKAGLLDDGFDWYDVPLGAIATAGDISAGILQGVGNLAEGVTDLGMYGIAGISDIVGADSFANSLKKTASENTVGSFFDNLREDSGMKDYSFLGDFGYGVSEGVGQVLGLIATGGIGGAAGLGAKGVSALTTGLMGASSMGSGISEAYQGGASDGEALAYGTIKGAVDTVSEMIFGGLGKGVKALGISKGLTSIDDMFAKKLSSKISNHFVKNLVQYGVKASAEGLEEVIAGLGSAAAKKLTYMSDKELTQLIEDENLLEQFASGMAVSAIAQGGDFYKANKSGTDFVSGLTDNEQSVIDKVYENRIAEEEKNGKLTSKEKNKIYDEVMEDLEKGGIDIDLIEEVLGGETYKNYKNTVDSEEALKNEYEELGKKTNPTLAEQTRYNELHEQMKDFEKNSKRNELKSQLGNEVFNLAKDGKLAESYYERARRNEKFTADVTKYKGKQAEIVQKAIDSGILNNTRRTHEFVDLVAKVSADKDVNFDFTNNDKLKESGFAVGGKFVNGYVTKDGITVNINSKKALNSVVGHEITHVLEGTELYKELENAIAEYAKTKDKDAYFKKFNELEELYRDVKDADIYKELTADLVGDYLFTDADFVRSLSTKNRNLFEKLFDEIKYLCKVATAGSKEARQLEKVKKTFQDIYREGGKTANKSGDIQYSLASEQTDKTYLDAVNRGDTETAQRMVDEAAKAAGYTIKAYHGTTGFGFTKVDVSYSDDGMSFFATDSLETAGTYSGTQETTRIADASKQTEEERDKIITEMYSTAIDLAEYCNRTLGIRGWVDYDHFDRQISEAIDDLEYGVKLTDIETDLLSFCDDLFYTFIDNYYDETYDDADHLGWEEWEDSEEYAELSSGFYGYVDQIINRFGLLDYDSSQGIYDLYANTDGLFEINAQGKRWNAIPFESSSGSYLVDTRRLARYAKAEGYKGVKITNVFDDGGKGNGLRKPATVYIFFNPQEQVKSADPITYDDNGNVIPLSERFKSENEDIRYSLSSVDDNQISNESELIQPHRSFSDDFANQTVNSFGITDIKDYVHVQRQVFKTLSDEGFFTSADKRSRTDVNEESGMVVETNKSGIDETFCKNNFLKLGKSKKISKLYTMRFLPEVIQFGRIIADNVDNKHNNGINKKFAYIEHPIMVDGENITVKIAIKKSPQKNKFWVHSVYTTKKVSDSPASTNNGTEAGHITADSKIIPQTSEKVNTFDEKNQKNSLSFEDEAPTRIRGGIYGEDVAFEAPVNNNLIDTNASKQSTEDAVKEIYAQNGWGDISKVVVDEDTGHAVDLGGLVDGIFTQWEMGEGIKGNAIFDLLDRNAVYEDGELTNEGELHSILEEKLKEAAPVYNSSLPAFAHNQFKFYKNAIAEERANAKSNRKPSISEVKRLTSTKPKDRKEFHGVRTSDGKQYWSNNAFFVVETNNTDTSVTENDSLAVDRFKDILKKGNDNASETRYQIDPIDISLIRKEAPKGMSVVVVGDTMFDVRYVDAVLKAIENPEVQLTTLNKTNDALLIKGSNGQALVVGINPNANVRSANFVYKADEITDTNAPQTDIAPISENVAPIKETVNEAPIAPIRNDVATENAEIIPNETRVVAADRGNVGTVKGYNATTNEYTVFFQGKNGTATVNISADQVSPLQNKSQNTSQGNESSVAQIRGSEAKQKKQNGFEWFRRNFVDKFSVFEDLSLKTGNRELMGKANFMLSSEQRAQNLIGNGNKAKGVKSLKDIKSEVVNDNHYDEFVEYMYHKHNIDRMSIEDKAQAKINGLQQKFGHLRTDQLWAIALTKVTDKTTPKTAQTIKEANEYLKALEAKNKPVFGDDITAQESQKVVSQYEAKYPQFKSFANDVYTYNNHLRSMMVENGIISQEASDLWTEMYPNYVPISRANKDADINVSLDKHKTNVNAPVKRATGGNSDIVDLFDTMGTRTEQTFKAVAKNNFGIELKNILGTTIEDTNADIDDIENSVDNPDGLLTPGLDGSSPTFTVFENGKRVSFEITEDMYNALKPTNQDLLYTNKVLNTAGNLQRGLLTEYSPVFTVKNAIKDVQDVLINSQHPLQTYKNIPKAFNELRSKGEWFNEYVENGGEQNTYFDSQSKIFTKEDEGFKKYIGIPFRAISTANNFVERIPRLAEYIASREAGASVEVAMLDAARVTTNFQAGGDVTKMANRNGFTFLNASVQGLAQNVRNVREAKANGLKGWTQLAAKTMIVGLPAVILNALLWDDDEEYEELSDYIKDNYYIVAKYGDGQFVRIPKGRTAAVIQDAFEQMGNLITGNDEVDLGNFLELAISNLAPNNPIDNNVIAPIVQTHTNKTWYGDDIVPTRLQDLPNAEQYDETTDAISKWLGEKTNLSPYRLNYLLDQISGGVGDVVLPMLTPEAERGNDSIIGKAIAPFTDAFTTDSTIKNQNVSDFYTKVDELTTSAKSSKATDEDILKYKYMNSIKSEISELYKQKREVQNSNLSDSQKYATVRELQKQINDLAEGGLNAYDNVRMGVGYATIGDRAYKLNLDGTWEKAPEGKSEYDITNAYLSGQAISKVLGGYDSYKTYSNELNDIKADKDVHGNSISGSRKEKVIKYVNSLDVDYGIRLIIYKSEYKSDHTYNRDIVNYLNSRDDLSYNDIKSILTELGFYVDEEGNISWD